MDTTLTDLERRNALRAYLRGYQALERAEGGDADAADEAIAHLHACLEWATPTTWPCLWAEAQIARADACVLRRLGDPLENAHTAIACYRAALGIYLEDMLRAGGFGSGGAGHQAMGGGAHDRDGAA
jgi:hypothetical protein